MKITAIICEFNPLHNGHKRLIDYAKTFSDKVICIMSGNFTQRGRPACCDKYARAKHAILSGADLVVELPTVFATASAENFAYGGVAIANNLNADYLLFGSECGDINAIVSCAHRLLDEQTNAMIAKEIKKGVSYPKAVGSAVGTTLLDKPNNVLGVEYVKAIINSKSNIVPLTITREDNFNKLTTGQYASSAALRTDKNLRGEYTYDYVTHDIDDQVENKFDSIVPTIISLKTTRDMRSIEGVTEGIENRIFVANKSFGYEKMLEEIKTKRYTRLRLQRTILNVILNIQKNDVAKAKSSKVYARPLAVKSNAAALLANTDNAIQDEITDRADRLYYSMSAATPSNKLIKID